jgi:tRNA dimethylallyltransferase
VAVELAQHFRCEIISADSRQVYAELNIGVNKPTDAQLKAAPHHLVGHISIHQKYDAGNYEIDALNRLTGLYDKGDIVVLAGGTGLYLRAVLEGLDRFPPVDEVIVNHLKLIHHDSGLKALQEELMLYDPEYYERVDRQNPHRLIRALAVIRSSGLKYSEFLSKQTPEREFIPIPILLNEERTRLYQRINQRVDEMIAGGLEEEALHLFPFRQLNALQTVGYREWFLNFENKISKEETIDKIKQHTRNYAKRQWTWFKPMQWPEYHAHEVQKMINYIENSLS